MVKVASICLWISGLGFGLPCMYSIWYFLKTRTIASVMGFPAYGNGPFERIGVHTTVPLLAGFLLVCTLECLCGWGLWRGEKGCGLLSLAIIPAEMLFFIGFALPFGPLFIGIRTVLLWCTWNALH